MPEVRPRARIRGRQRPSGRLVGRRPAVLVVHGLRRAMGACVKVSVITPTDHERKEWARMAQSCSEAGKSVQAGLFKAASLLVGPMQPWTYDCLQKNYRHWLLVGTDALSDEGVDL